MNENVFQPSINEDGEKGFFISEPDIKGLKFTTKQQRDQYKKHLEKESNRNNIKFTNTNMNKIDYICDNFTNTQIGFLVILQCHIDYDGNLIKSQKDKTPLKTGDLQKILGLDGKRRTFYDFKNKCLCTGILNYDGLKKAYSINKKFIFKGAFKGMGMDVVSMVTKEMKEISEALKPTDLAILFKLQKYVHINSMALVRNPNETNKEKIETLKATDLVEILGVSKNYIYSRLPKLIYNGQALIAQVKAGKKKSYMLNPNVFFRGDYTQIQENVTHPNGVFFNV